MAPILLVILGEQILRRKCPAFVLQAIVITELTCIFIVSIADPEFFIQWGNKFNNQVLVYVTHPREMLISSGSVQWVKTIPFAIALLALFVVFYRQILKILKKPLDFTWKQLILVILASAINFVFLRGGIGVATISQSSAINSSSHLTNVTAINSLWNAMYYIINDTRSLYGNQHRFLSSVQADSLFKSQMHGYKDGFLLSDQSRPNILVIMLESFTASASKYFTGANNLTPGLDRIADENLSFMRCYASGDRTEKGLVSVNSGYPSQPVSSIIIFPDKVRKLPGLSRSIKPYGYTNTFIYGGDAEFASMNSYLLQQGFDRIIDKSDFPVLSLTSKWGAHDEQLYQKALLDMDAVKGPFYTLLLSLSSHEPYDVPFKSPDLPKDVWYGYKNSLRYADYCLVNFLDACKTKPWYANTLIVLVADHGHDIGLEGNFFFGSEKYHIPLIITGGALKENLRSRKMDAVVSQTIIPGMLLQTMHISNNDFYWQTPCTDSSGFAQYHFNNGFGRINNQSECVYDNNGMSYFFKGFEGDRERIKYDGRVFQQVLIDNFLQK